MTRSVAIALLLLSATSAYGQSICEQAWERVQRLRAEAGLQPVPYMKDPLPLRPERACRILLEASDEQIRAGIQDSIEICGGDCRDLLPETQEENR